MKRYPNCVHKLFYEPLIITPSRHAALCKVLEARMDSPIEVPMPDGVEEPDEDDQMRVVRADAIIPIHGVLTCHADDIPASSCGCGCDTVSEMIKVCEADDSIETVLFDFRTPGGAVNGIPELGSQIARMHKNTIGFTDSECCSAGLWLAMQCEQFYCTESASVGSIGVWCAYLDISRQMQNEGVAMQTISAGKYKLLGAYWRPMTDGERAMLQADVDKIYGKFKEAVLNHREISDEYMQGQVFDGEKACEIGLCDGLVDGIGDLIED